MKKLFVNKLQAYKRIYEESNKRLMKTWSIIHDELPPRYHMNCGCIEFIDFLLKEIDFDYFYYDQSEEYYKMKYE